METDDKILYYGSIGNLRGWWDETDFITRPYDLYPDLPSSFLAYGGYIPLDWANGRCVLVQLAGWSAISFWGKQRVQVRACTFAMRGRKNFNEIKNAAQERFPHVLKDLGFSLWFEAVVAVDPHRDYEAGVSYTAVGTEPGHEISELRFKTVYGSNGMTVAVPISLVDMLLHQALDAGLAVAEETADEIRFTSADVKRLTESVSVFYVDKNGRYILATKDRLPQERVEELQIAINKWAESDKKFLFLSGIDLYLIEMGE